VYVCFHERTFFAGAFLTGISSLLAASRPAKQNQRCTSEVTDTETQKRGIELFGKGNTTPDDIV
jgi:hypothetical protein